MPHRPLRIAHRGASLEHRENTLAAFGRALELGADGIELDVHATRDGVVVVHHDPQLGADPALGPLAGRPIAQLTSTELLDARVSGRSRVPTLDEVCELVGHHAELFVEIKGTGIEREVATCLSRHAGRFAVHSFDHGGIARMRAIAPDLRRGILFDETPADLAGAIAAAGAADIWPRGDLASVPLIEAAHAEGARVIVWTVNRPEDAAQLAARGVDGICTDDVRTLSPISL